MNPYISFSSRYFNSSPTKDATGFPKVIQVTPFADNNNIPVPVVSFNTIQEMPRCSMCRAFMSKQMTWTRLGGKYICGYCRQPNEKFYLRYKYMERDGVGSFPELVDDVYDFEYQPPTPKLLQTIILIDTSLTFAQSNDYLYMINALKNYVDQNMRQYAYFAVITYNTSVTCYKFGESFSKIVLPVIDEDMRDLVIPHYKNLFCTIDDKAKLDALFQSLQDIQSIVADADGLSKGCCYGAALKLAVDLLNNRGGTVIDVCGTKGTVGCGVSNRLISPSSTYTENREYLQPNQALKFYQDIAIKCSELGVVVNNFFFSRDYCDVATLGEVSHITNGILKVYEPNKTQFEVLTNDVNAMTPSAYACALRMRIPSCLEVETVGGHFFQRSATNYACSVMRKDTTLLFELSGGCDANYRQLKFQLAISFSLANGARRTRVINLEIDTSNFNSDVLRQPNLPVAMNGYIFKVIKLLKEKDLSGVKSEIEGWRNSMIQNIGKTDLTSYLYALMTSTAVQGGLTNDLMYSEMYQLQRYSPYVLNYLVQFLYAPTASF
ncbi:protein transport protein SEC24, putative [Entamoeba invadens IP1]|uniref:Protein transport protein SEC24, putative n=1 Tax=Entamoeba invadens IP1 TaxID=370355 RepID=A0A0A1UEN0_ENTIV|nr:protein transport protein SEC24, putative [Entamoeba invadens IP1]ELP95036.1 protein transport protein SEC24, putative [Entamoeba invadens IP1]|eukprot:XP_004261807.1 protein transport protein SEC24, putative [Entamoeba invadens IP1]